MSNILVIATPGRRIDPKLHMSYMLAASLMGRECIILPPHMAPVGAVEMSASATTELLKLQASKIQYEPKYTDLKQTPRQRSHPNEPFYRGLDRRRRRW